jgi:predicted DCC family thiol-disulfide oxidoreductase YuxK
MNGWTGGQYSVVRVALGALLLVRASAIAASGAGAHSALALLAAGGAAVFALGWRDRLVAGGLCAWTLLAAPFDPRLGEPTRWIPSLLLLVHVLLPAAPYGSLDARDRPDPASGWTLPDPLLRSVRWLALTVLVWIVGWLAAGHALASPAAVVLLAALACDPVWVPSRAFASAPRIYYDGDCGLCHTTVRFLLSEDRGGATRYAPFASETFASERDLPADLPDSVIVRVGDRVLVRSAGVLALGEACGGLWRVLAIVVGLVPRVVLDAAYDRVAAVRHRLFSRPEGLCPILPPELRRRFLP